MFSFRIKYLLVPVAIVLFFVALFFFDFSNKAESVRQFDNFEKKYAQRLKAQKDMAEMILKSELAYHTLAKSPVDQAEQVKKNLHRELKRILSYTPLDLQAELEFFQEELLSYFLLAKKYDLAERELALHPESQALIQRKTELGEQLNKLRLSNIKRIDRFIEGTENSLKKYKDNSQALIQEQSNQSLTLALIFVVLLSLYLLWITRQFLKPLRGFKKFVEDLSQGNLAAPWKTAVNSRDELGQLAKLLIQLRGNLKSIYQQQDFFHHWIQCGFDFLILYDKDQGILEVSESLCTATAYDREFLLGKKLELLIKTPSCVPFDQFSDSISAAEIDSKWLDKESVTISVSMKAMQLEEKHPNVWLLVARDLRKQIEAEQSLQVSDRQLKVFKSEMGHIQETLFAKEQEVKAFKAKLTTAKSQRNWKENTPELIQGLLKIEGQVQEIKNHFDRSFEEIQNELQEDPMLSEMSVVNELIQEIFASIKELQGNSIFSNLGSSPIELIELTQDIVENISGSLDRILSFQIEFNEDECWVEGVREYIYYAISGLIELSLDSVEIGKDYLIHINSVIQKDNYGPENPSLAPGHYIKFSIHLGEVLGKHQVIPMRELLDSLSNVSYFLPEKMNEENIELFFSLVQSGTAS